MVKPLVSQVIVGSSPIRYIKKNERGRPMDINNFPDILVDKQTLIEQYFPSFKKKTLEKYLTEIRKNEQFQQITISPSSRLTLINPRGFFDYLKYRETQKFI